MNIDRRRARRHARLARAAYWRHEVDGIAFTASPADRDRVIVTATDGHEKAIVVATSAQWRDLRAGLAVSGLHWTPLGPEWTSVVVTQDPEFRWALAAR
jgi:hypothetical protein